MLNFWELARSELRELCGDDPKKRDRTGLREELARELRQNGRTFNGFLNKHQKSLGSDALPGLFARIPRLRTLYEQATGRAWSAASGEAGAASTGAGQHYVQMTLQFEGFDDQPQSMTAHIPAGREGVLILRIAARRPA
jgi:hypothetical protein